MNYTQVYLKTKEGDVMTTWLDANPKIAPGVKVSLKKDDRVWNIEEVYETRPLNDIEARGWDNNDYSKHTGLWS